MRIRSAVTAGLAATALVLAGCGSGDDNAASSSQPAASSQVEESSAPVEASAESSAAPSEESTSQESTSEETSTSEESAESSASAGSGDIQAFAAALTEANKSVTAVKGSATGTLNGQPLLQLEYQSAVANGVPTAMQMSNSTSAGGQTVAMDILMVDGKWYLGGDTMLQQLGVTGGKWVLLDKNSSNPVIAQLATQMETQTQAQGTAQVEQMVAVAKGLEEVGSEDVDGVPTTHYRLTLDAAEAAKLSGASPGEQSETATAVGDIPVDLWVDENNRTVQMEMNLDVQGQTLTMTMKMYDYDVPVEIAAPAPEEIAEVPAG